MLLEKMGNQSAVARALGISAAAVSKYVKRNACCQKAVEQARESFCDFAESALLKRIKSGDTTAIIYTLKQQGKQRGWSQGFEGSAGSGKKNSRFSDAVKKGRERRAPSNRKDGVE